MISPVHVSRLKDELADVAFRFLSEQRIVPPESPHGTVQTLVDSFFELYPNRPVVDNAGGSRFHNCFWLYLVARSLAPSLIIESGTWKGQSSWLFRTACPGATIHCFDPNLRRLVYRHDSIHYHETDWQNWHVDQVNPAQSLCFFDDHINQARRIREAHARGFRRLIFDDDPPAHKVYSFGYPGTPTVGMVMDTSLRPGDVLEWVWRGEPRRYVYPAEDVTEARKLVARYGVFPDIAGPTRHGDQTFLSYVELAEL